MALLRSLTYAALFYAGTFLHVVTGVLLLPLGRGPALAVVLNWMDYCHWIARHVLGIRIRMDGTIPEGPYLIAVKHQAMFETTEMVRLARRPVIVLKRELYDIPLFGALTHHYGVIAVERNAGAKALRAMVAAGKEAVDSGRAVLIYPEGTRVRVGQTPPLQAGFAGLYRALGLPVVPIALDSGRLWGRGLIHRSGTVTFKVGQIIPAGLKREEIEARVHAAINALELAPEARA